MGKKVTLKNKEVGNVTIEQENILVKVAKDRAIPGKKTIINKSVIVKDKEGKEFEVGLLNTNEITLKTDRNFFKLWLPKYTKFSKDCLIMTLWMHFLAKMHHNNKLIINHMNLAEKYKTTRQTISNTIKKLIKMEFCKYKCNVIFVNPNLIWKGTVYGREKAVEDYNKNIFTD